MKKLNSQWCSNCIAQEETQSNTYSNLWTQSSTYQIVRTPTLRKEQSIIIITSKKNTCLKPCGNQDHMISMLSFEFDDNLHGSVGSNSTEGDAS